jgi:thiol-disulfide isomerase/thioredoxin
MEKSKYFIINSIDEVESILQKEDITLLYFSAERCNVCKALKPKIQEMAEQFPEMQLYYIDIEKNQEFSGRFGIFSIPVILVYIQGKETIRESRNISVPVLEDKIHRYYHLLFNQ